MSSLLLLVVNLLLLRYYFLFSCFDAFVVSFRSSYPDICFSNQSNTPSATHSARVANNLVSGSASMTATRMSSLSLSNSLCFTMYVYQYMFYTEPNNARCVAVVEMSRTVQLKMNRVPHPSIQSDFAGFVQRILYRFLRSPITRSTWMRMFAMSRVPSTSAGDNCGLPLIIVNAGMMSSAEQMTVK